MSLKKQQRHDTGIVLADTELDEAALRGLYTGAFLTLRQVCMTLKRLYVHRSRFDEVVRGLSGILEQLALGNGRNLGYKGIVAFQGYHSISAPAGSIF